MTRYSFTLIDPWRSGKKTFENYLGFPDGIAGQALLERGRQQVERYGVEIVEDEIQALAKEGDVFHVTGQNTGLDPAGTGAPCDRVDSIYLPRLQGFVNV